MNEHEHLTEVDNELREASLELNHANERYYNAILARIALRTVLRMENMQ